MGPKWNSLRLLIVEDQPHMRAILRTVLREFGVGHIEDAGGAGATEFLTKPLVPAHLYRRLQMAIEEPRPFVRSESYFGPDRRRRIGQFHSGSERRQEATQPA